jgi:hypothetical protein
LIVIESPTRVLAFQPTLEFKTPRCIQRNMAIDENKSCGKQVTMADSATAPNPAAAV